VGGLQRYSASTWKLQAVSQEQVPDMDFITHNGDSCPENGQPLIGAAVLCATKSRHMEREDDGGLRSTLHWCAFIRSLS
jgi:hypothetical protein